MNNDIYKETYKNLGKREMAISDQVHEGLALALDKDSVTHKASLSQLHKGLPFLNKAIALAKGQKNDKVPLIEYFSAKGEIYHILSHLDMKNDAEWDAKSLNGFAEAFKTLESVKPALLSSRPSAFLCHAAVCRRSSRCEVISRMWETVCSPNFRRIMSRYDGSVKYREKA